MDTWSKVSQEEPPNAAQDFAHMEIVDAVGEDLAEAIFETRDAYQELCGLGSRLIDGRLFQFYSIARSKKH